MGKASAKSLLQIYASMVTNDPIARDEACLRLAGLYDNDPLRIRHASECASKKTFFYGNSDHGMQPDPKVVRADFAAWLVINKVKPDEKSVKLSPEQEWDLMLRVSMIDDKILSLMMLEAGYSSLAPAGVGQPGQSSALQRFVDKANAGETRMFIGLLPEVSRAEVVGYVDGAGRNVAHYATHNTNSGVMTVLKEAGADLDLVFTANGKVPARRAAHMAVLAGNVKVTAELGVLVPHQFQATPACPVTPYEVGMERIQNNESTVPRPVSSAVKASHAKNPMQQIKPTNPEEEAQIKARAELLQRVMESTDIAASFLGVPPPFGNTAKVDAAQRAVGHAGSRNALN